MVEAGLDERPGTQGLSSGILLPYSVRPRGQSVVLHVIGRDDWQPLATTMHPPILTWPSFKTSKVCTTVMIAAPQYTQANYLVQASLRWTGTQPRSVLLAKAHNFWQVEARRCSQYMEEAEEAGQPASQPRCPSSVAATRNSLFGALSMSA